MLQTRCNVSMDTVCVPPLWLVVLMFCSPHRFVAIDRLMDVYVTSILALVVRLGLAQLLVPTQEGGYVLC